MCDGLSPHFPPAPEVPLEPLWRLSGALPELGYLVKNIGIWSCTLVVMVPLCRAPLLEAVIATYGDHRDR